MQEWNERRVNTWSGKLERSWFRRTRGQRIAASCVLAASGLVGFVALVCTAAWSGSYHGFDTGIWEFIRFHPDYIVLLAVFYTVLPVIFGTEKGFRRIGRPPVDAALGMGMDRRQLFFRVMLPLASQQVMVGLRKAAVTAVGMVTLATMRGGGLGVLILDGIQQGSGDMVLAGAAPACLMALAADLGMALLGRRVVPAPLRRREKRVLYIAK